MSSRLPPEIVEAIIDNLWEDTASLKKCALVSSAWLSSARSHLFYRINLDPPTNQWGSRHDLSKRESPCEKFFNILESSSDSDGIGNVSRYVREIHLCEGTRMCEWLAHERTLPSLLRLLYNLRRFEITGSSFVRIIWGRLHEALKVAIQDHVLCLPSLTELKLGRLILDNLSVMMDLLQSCRRLTILEVDHICFADEAAVNIEMGNMDAVPKEKQLLLGVLDIGLRTSIAFVKWLLHPSSCINLETIRNLTLSISGTSDDFARLLHASFSVEHLELTLTTDINLEAYWKLPPPFDLSRVPHLQTLKVNIEGPKQVDQPLPWLKALLDSGNSLSRQNAIVKIWIIYTLHIPTSAQVVHSLGTNLDEWVDIDALLCGAATQKDSEPGQDGSHAYERLKEVKLEFIIENWMASEVAPQFLKKLVLDSPGLEKRGIPVSLTAFDKMKKEALGR